MKAILCLMVMACVVFGASLTKINTERKIDTSKKRQGTYTLSACSDQTLWDKLKVVFRGAACKLTSVYSLKNIS